MILRSRKAIRSIQSLSSSSSSANAALPDFLIPAYATRPSIRQFSCTSLCKSRVGTAPVAVPPEVEFKILDPPPRKKNENLRIEAQRTAEIVGPLGKISLQIPSFIKINYDGEARKATLEIQDRKIRKQREMWGTIRAHLANHVLGVSEGHAAVIRMVGVGYRATLEPTAVTRSPEYPGQQFINLKVGFTHPIELGVPQGMKASIPQPTRILLEGTVKEVVNQFAAEIRQWRRPEPYKGKGIFVNGETIKLKPKRIK